MADNPTSKNLIAVVIGAVILFGVISVIPIVIMRRHRRRAAERHADELQSLEANGTMRQITVQRWLDQQTINSDENLERYVDELCPICLTSLLDPCALSHPDSVSQNQHTPTQTQPLPCPPAAAHISPAAAQVRDDHRARPPQVSDPSCHETKNPWITNTGTVLILNRCNHAFHTACLASWLEYRHYRCPICADVLFSV